MIDIPPLNITFNPTLSVNKAIIIDDIEKQYENLTYRSRELFARSKIPIADIISTETFWLTLSGMITAIINIMCLIRCVWRAFCY